MRADIAALRADLQERDGHRHRGPPEAGGRGGGARSRCRTRSTNSLALPERAGPIWASIWKRRRTTSRRSTGNSRSCSTASMRWRSAGRPAEGRRVSGGGRGAAEEGSRTPNRQARDLQPGPQQARGRPDAAGAGALHRVPGEVSQGRALVERAVLAGRDLLCREEVERCHQRVPEGAEGVQGLGKGRRLTPEDRHVVPGAERLQERHALLRRAAAGASVEPRREVGERAHRGVQQEEALTFRGWSRRSGRALRCIDTRAACRS